MRALVENPHKRVGFDDEYFEVQVTGRTASSVTETLVEIKWVEEDQVHTKWLSGCRVYVIKEAAE